MRPGTNQVFAFPTRKLVEKDVNGALFAEFMAHTERCAAFLDGPGRKIAKASDVHAAVAYGLASMRLTRHMVDGAGVLLLARDWLAGKTEADFALAHLDGTRLPVGAWWGPATPDALRELCVIADALLARLRTAAGRLRMALEQEQAA